jgi:hypothetical protein
VWGGLLPFWSFYIVGNRREIHGQTSWHSLEGHLFRHKNIIGPSTVPWGTPESTDVFFELSPSTIVLIVLVDRKLVSHEWMFPLIPYGSSLCRSLSCGTVSNALENSKMAMSTCCPLSCSCRKSSKIGIQRI